MKKNLVEELRDNRECSLFLMLDRITGANGQTKDLPTQAIANALADRIESEFLPRPRFEDGEPVHKGSETAWGRVSFYEVDQNGDFTLHYEEGGDCSEYTMSERVERPVLDADGVPCLPGDTVYLARPGAPAYGGAYTVQGMLGDGTLRMQGKTIRYDPKDFSHERPDTLEAIEADVEKYVVDYWGCMGSSCASCPAAVGGKSPRERYDTENCILAKWKDLFFRAMRLKKQ